MCLLAWVGEVFLIEDNLQKRIRACQIDTSEHVSFFQYIPNPLSFRYHKEGDLEPLVLGQSKFSDVLLGQRERASVRCGVDMRVVLREHGLYHPSMLSKYTKNKRAVIKMSSLSKRHLQD